jgi:hypothetical protein
VNAARMSCKQAFVLLKHACNKACHSGKNKEIQCCFQFEDMKNIDEIQQLHHGVNMILIIVSE